MSLLKHGLTKPELRRAIGRGELVLHYQPEADLRTGEIHDVEALVRWRNLGLRVVAEGVETARAWRGLVQLGCDIDAGVLPEPSRRGGGAHRVAAGSRGGQPAAAAVGLARQQRCQRRPWADNA